MPANWLHSEGSEPTPDRQVQARRSVDSTRSFLPQHEAVRKLPKKHSTAKHET